MKRIVVLMALIFSTMSSSAQKVQELEESRIEVAPESSILVTGSNSVVIKIPEAYSGEFERNPLKFMKENFDIKQVLAQMEQNEKYYVTFKNRKGQLKADFNKNGKLLNYYLKFVNVRVPHELMTQLYKEYKGWAVVKTVRVARGNETSTDRAYYKVVMKNGTEKKSLKFNAFKIPSEVASDIVTK